jgi:hypothetical protein
MLEGGNLFIKVDAGYNSMGLSQNNIIRNMQSLKEISQ